MNLTQLLNYIIIPKIANSQFNISIKLDISKY